MSLYNLWRDSPEQVREKQVSQLIAFAGDGRLKDGSRAADEFRDFLMNVTSDLIRRYVEECLAQSFADSGLALQDLVNEVGRRLGFQVSNGRYRGSQTEVAFDGLWKAADGTHLVVEVKTTDAYRMDLNTVAGYRRRLIKFGEAQEDRTSILIVVGRQDTGDLEAQIRGSQHAWDIRLISAEALLRLLAIKEEVEDPGVSERIRSILIPREYTRVDEIIDLVFSTAEDIKQDEPSPSDEADRASKEERGPKFKPVRFHEASAKKVAAHLGLDLIRQSRAYFRSADGEVGVLCAVSKEHAPDTTPNYWFAFHPHQKQWLDEARTAYVAFGCGGPDKIVLIPYPEFRNWLPGLHQTHLEDRSYWHVQISDQDGKLRFHGKKEIEQPDVTSFLLGSATSG